MLASLFTLSEHHNNSGMLIAMYPQATLLVLRVIRGGKLADVETVEPPAILAELLSAFKSSKLVNAAGNRVIGSPVLAGIYEIHESLSGESLQPLLP